MNRLLSILEFDGEGKQTTRKELITSGLNCRPLVTISRKDKGIVEKVYSFDGVGGYDDKVIGFYSKRHPIYKKLNNQLLKAEERL